MIEARGAASISMGRTPHEVRDEVQLGAEIGPQLLQGAVHGCLHRAARDAQRVRDVIDAHVGEESQCHHLAFASGKPTQGVQ